MKNKNKREGIMYSTNPDFVFGDDESRQPTSPGMQELRIHLDRKSGSKLVSRITGFSPAFGQIDILAKKLKAKCGVGGSAKDGEILIQGDFRDRLIPILEEEGFRVKKSGG